MKKGWLAVGEAIAGQSRRHESAALSYASTDGKPWYAIAAPASA